MARVKTSKNVTIFSRTQTAAEWAEELGITRDSFHTRRYRYPNDPHIWVKKPRYQNTSPSRISCLTNEQGIKKSMDDWMRHYDVFIPVEPAKRNYLKQKIKARVEKLGWEFERSFTEDIFRNEPMENYEKR